MKTPLELVKPQLSFKSKAEAIVENSNVGYMAGYRIEDPVETAIFFYILYPIARIFYED